MRVLIVTGIWPPDVGGPASHAPEIAQFLHTRGHSVEVVTTADGKPAREPYDVHWVARRLPVGARHAVAVAAIAKRARRADVVYCTGMVGRTAIATALARSPLVLKLTSDPAYERALRYRLHVGGLEEFQVHHGARLSILRAVRDFALGHAARIVCPSEALRSLAAGWGIDAARIDVVPNPVSAPPLASRDELRFRHGFDGPTLVFAGRIAPQKSLDVGLEALRRVEGVSLVVAGDGPERERITSLARELGLDGRARFLGPQPRQTVFELLGAADAALLPSSWENFPHTVVESLAVGTPVIATAVGGVPEVVKDGENGLLVPAGDAEALAAAIHRFFGERGLRERLAAAAAPSVAGYGSGETLARIEAVLLEAAR